MNELAPTIAFTALAGMAALSVGAGMYRLSAGKEITEIARGTYTSPAMEKARTLAQARKRLESCVIPENTYNTPAPLWDGQTKDCLRDAKEYNIFGGDLDKLKNTEAIQALLKSHSDYWAVFDDKDAYGTQQTGFEPFSTPQHMDAALDIMKRRDWLANSDLTGKVFELLEESYNKYAECGRENLYGERDQRCIDSAAQVRSNYILLNREMAKTVKSTHIPLDALDRLEGK